MVGLGCGGGGEAAVTIIQRHLRELLLGRTVERTADIAAIWDDLYRATLPYGRRGLAIMALSGIDLALWDLLARSRGAPVYELLGGAHRQRVRAYATGSDVEWFAEQGFTAHKRSHRWTGHEQGYDAAARCRAPRAPTPRPGRPAHARRLHDVGRGGDAQHGDAASRIRRLLV